MGLLNMLNPIKIGVAPLDNNKAPAAIDTPNSFKESLRQAQCHALPNVESSDTGLLKNMIDIGLGAAMNNPLQMGSASMDVLQKMMGYQVNEQFGSLGSAIGMQFMDALAGKDSATQIIEELPDQIVESAKTMVESGVKSELATPELGKKIKESTIETQSKLDKLEFRNRTLPWQLEQERLKDILEKREKDKQATS